MKSFLILTLLLSFGTPTAWAANTNREKQMLRRMQQQIQQIEQARGVAEQEKAAALADKETAERALDNLKSDEAKSKHQLVKERDTRTRAEKELTALKMEMDQLKTRLTDTEMKLAESNTLHQTAAQKLVQLESLKRQTDSQLAGKEKDFDMCQTHNGRLYEIGREMMQKYRDKTCQDALAQAEPFTGIKKVEVENLLETWRDRLDREQLPAKP